jgi:hypothetical protein
MSRQLSDWDFINGNPKPHSRIVVIATLTDFAAAGQDDPGSFPKWFNNNAARTVWWCSDSNEVKYDLDRPSGGKLAAQVALSVRYEEEACEFETRRYFYDGPCDPFTEDVRTVPSDRLQEVGVFVLPGNRQWEKLLSFGSSSFLKVLKSAHAIPGTSVEALKLELQDPTSKIEASPELKPLLDRAEQELRGFLLMEEGAALAYRPTTLDATAVLQSLIPHILTKDGSLLPFARSGSGTVSLQAFLIVLAFAEQRRQKGKNFILLAEEPELHLHPPLHRRLANRIRSLSNQSIVTTHSPLIAGSFEATSALYVLNNAGTLTATPVDDGTDTQQVTAVRNLYSKHRESLYEALMGPLLVIPEGEYDFHWLRALQRAAETIASSVAIGDLTPLTLVRTQASSVVETFLNISRLRKDAIPFVDGDTAGKGYVEALDGVATKPKVIIQLGNDAGIEYLAAWILEPSLTCPKPSVESLLPDPVDRTLKNLQKAVADKKKDMALAEELAWEALDTPACAVRLTQFFSEMSTLINQTVPKQQTNWTFEQRASGIIVWHADFIQKA